MRLIRLLLATTAALHAEAVPPGDPPESAYPALERFVEVLETVRERHPNLDKLAYDRLINQALDGMLGSLDPHSSFIHPEMSQPGNEELLPDNEVKSLGLSLGKDSDGLFVSALEELGPADTAGILPGTRILGVNGLDPQELSFYESLELFHGDPGGEIELTLRDPERPGEIEKVLTHRWVDDRSVVESTLLEKHPDIGYLRLANFGPDCASEVESALDDLEDQGMKKLILDLRNNGGGDLHQTVKILGLFVPPGSTVVTVRERGESVEALKTPERQRRERSYPIAILQDRNSASASELTAGALRDLKRATLIGEKSYGKGSVQDIVPMGGGTALRLTIATYHTPSGETPHLKGIVPDVEVVISEADRLFFQKAGRPTSLTPEEREALAAWSDPSMAAAIKVLGE